MVLPFLQAIIAETIGDILYWPVWWYSRGLKGVIAWAIRCLKDANDAVGFTLWLKAMGEPMYGQNDWQGRLISFWFRLIILIARFVIMLGWTLCITGFVVSYIALLPLCLWRII